MDMKNLFKKISPKEKGCCLLEIEEKRQHGKMENEGKPSETQRSQKSAEK
ncbi:alcohol dehydrogenase [Salinicoccus luteus]|nr:alcohol dehydrogenase [Salinicoccus luteus]